MQVVHQQTRGGGTEHLAQPIQPQVVPLAAEQRRPEHARRVKGRPAGTPGKTDGEQHETDRERSETGLGLRCGGIQGETLGVGDLLDGHALLLLRFGVFERHREGRVGEEEGQKEFGGKHLAEVRASSRINGEIVIRATHRPTEHECDNDHGQNRGAQLHQNIVASASVTQLACGPQCERHCRVQNGTGNARKGKTQANSLKSSHHGGGESGSFARPVAFVTVHNDQKDWTKEQQSGHKLSINGTH
mmetsp:Transcript_2968/g.4950  ORF Transcript_2968/g.4950 Transcript_2968/m.4950 type:complete len:246 (-) Transcript_2968:245-982(-)